MSPQKEWNCSSQIIHVYRARKSISSCHVNNFLHSIVKGQRRHFKYRYEMCWKKCWFSLMYQLSSSCDRPYHFHDTLNIWWLYHDIVNTIFSMMIVYQCLLFRAENDMQNIHRFSREHIRLKHQMMIQELSEDWNSILWWKNDNMEQSQKESSKRKGQISC